MYTIYIGISKRFDCVRGVTERSIREHATGPVDIVHLYPEVETGCTGFSDVRYTIREGIYLDCDMILLAPIQELMAYHVPGKYACMSDGATEVAVIDCPNGHGCRNKRELSALPIAPVIPLEWNSEDRVMPGAKLVHFTALDWQPWFYEHPDPEAVALYRRYASA
jgi:hypothetical protein